MQIRENVSLAPFTTLGVGGPARFFAEAASREDLGAALAFAKEKALPIFVLGKGSNLVLSDEGFPGLVILSGLKKFEISEDAEGAFVAAGAGEDWDSFVERCVAAGLAGLENLSGIPGSVGAAPVQNVGAYGESADRTIVGVRAIDLRTGDERTFSKEECRFGYRDSIFKHDRNFFITDVTFRLKKYPYADISSYHDIQKYFEGRTEPVTLAEARQAVLEIRSRKGMVIRPEYESFRSVGSFFKNPVVPREIFDQAKEAVDAEGEQGGCRDPWYWQQADGRVKISAACLMERAGFPKGYARGPVGISPKHSLALVNVGGAKAADIAGLARDIQNAVQEKFGVHLEPEAEFVGSPAGFTKA